MIFIRFVLFMTQRRISSCCENGREERILADEGRKPKLSWMKIAAWREGAQLVKTGRTGHE